MLRTICVWAFVALALTFPLAAEGYMIAQADLEETIRPLEGDVSATEFYAYDAEARRSRNPLVERRSSYLFLYRAPDGRLYLFVIHGPSDTGMQSVAAEFRIVGVPPGAEWRVKDDPPEVLPNDVYDLAGERARWEWGGAFMYHRTSGGVLGPLGEGFEIRVTPEQFPGTQELFFLSGDVAQPDRIRLNPRDTIIITDEDVVRVIDVDIPPEARFSLQPVEPRMREEVVFDARASDHDPAAVLEEYFWSFGDGVSTTTTEPVVRHTYLEVGTYEASLTVVDSAGNQDTIWQTVVVSEVAVTAQRSISTDEATPGSSFRVRVRISTEQTLSGAGLEESLPGGWEVKPVESAGAVFRQSSTQWVFVDPIPAGTEPVITYDVVVPRAEELRSLRLPYTIDISGIFQAKSPNMEMAVGGESRVIITDCLSVKTAVAHLVPASQPGERDHIDLRLSEVITVEQLARAGELWRTDEAVVGTCGERISLSTLKNLTAYAESCVPVDRPLPDMTAPELTAVRTIRTPIPCEGVVLGFYDSTGVPYGNTFTVRVEITSDVDVMGVGLDEHLPAGWQVSPVQNDGFLYKPSQNQWALLGTLKGGERRTIIYEVTVPPSTNIEGPPRDECGVLAAESVVGRADTGWPCVDVPVRGNTRVELTDCLDIIVAISRWDVKEERINLLLSDRITFEQLQRAVAFWLEDEPVPHTCHPSKVDYETLKELVALWSTGTPICKVLPEAPPGPCD